VRLIPRDEGFFTLFGQLAEKLTASTKLLQDMLANSAHFERYAAQIKEIERECDQITRTVIVRLDESFVTPLDREDIHLLASRIDNVVDLVDGTARRMIIFNVSGVREPAQALADVLHRAAQLIERGVRDIKKRQEVIQCSFEIKRLEEEGDVIFTDAMRELFAGTPDPLDVIKWKALYDQMEFAVDECEDVANVLESVSLKNS
jgi:predicted phosphate transport protein (TIGR00153 family)